MAALLGPVGAVPAAAAVVGGGDFPPWFVSPYEKGWPATPPPQPPSDYPAYHRAWCAATYWNYDAASDSYFGADGRRHRCVSPPLPRR